MSAAGQPLRLPFPACPLCGGGPQQRIVSADARLYPHYDPRLPEDHAWVRCTACGHVHAEHYWTEAGLAILLARSHAHQVAGGADFETRRRVWAPVVKGVAEELRAQGRDPMAESLFWFDVGCGDGALVMTAAEFGFDAVGLDRRGDAAQALRARGHAALEGDLMQVSGEGNLHVVSLMDILEHLPDPAAVLAKVRTLLRPDGLLLVSCPNMDSPVWREMDRLRANPYWVELEHCHNFSRNSLSALLRRCGFRPLSYDISLRYKAGMDLLSKVESPPSCPAGTPP